jgi:hypothetical protein
MTSQQRFAQLLTEGIHRIRLHTSKTIQAVQDELGYALGRKGGSAIEYWRKGHLPPRQSDIEALARTLVRQAHMERQWLEEFLRCADHPAPLTICEELFPTGKANSDKSLEHDTARSTAGASATLPYTAHHLNGSPPGTDSPAESANDELMPVPERHAFIVGPPITHPRHFFGRKYELKYLFGLWQRFPLQHVAVLGSRRSGKTSLLHYLKCLPAVSPEQMRPNQIEEGLELARRYQWVFVDFQDARMRTQQRLLRHVLAGLNLPVPQPCDLYHFMDVVSEQLRTPTIVMLDELSAALTSPWSLRSLCSNQTHGRLGFLLTSHDSPAELASEHNKPSPFFNIFGHTLRLGPFTEVEARELIAGSPVPFAPESVEWILAHSGRWPSLLQMLCHTHLIALENGAAGDAWKNDGLRRIAPYRYLLEEP